MSMLDIYNIYFGTSVDPTYPPNGSIADWTPASLTAGTTYSAAINHNQGKIPLAGTTGNTYNGSQYVEPFVGEAQVLVLKVITPPAGGATAITVNLLTDIDNTGTNSPATLATLTVPYATVADTYFVLELTPAITFKIYSLLDVVVPTSETVGIAAWLTSKKALDFIPNYVSGWVVLS
jgi:hypothetical protein